MIAPESGLAAVWIAWAISWTAARLWADRVAARASVGRQLVHYVPGVAGGVLLVAGRSARGWPAWTTWRLGAPAGWALLALILLGLLLTWWARIHLGRLWSGTVTRKPGHRIVDTGPYGVVRHPIYSGLLPALAATGVLRGNVVALLGAAILILSLYLKARLEERFLGEFFAAGEYAAYARRVPMLIPLPRRRPSAASRGRP